MFRKTLFFSLMLLCLLYVGGGLYLGWVRQQDIDFIQDQLDHRRTARSSALFSATEQKRKGVVKEIWISPEEGPRLHHRISSKTSLLTILPSGNKLDLVEKLYDTTCWMQDKLYATPLEGALYEQVRLLKAAEGFYQYSSQEFTAHTVDLSLYRLPGQELPFQAVNIPPFLKGIAKNVSFSVSGKNSQFKAQEFKAELNSSPEKS